MNMVIAMNNYFNQVTVSKICAVVFVPAGVGKSIHKDRKYHGLVMNDDSVKDYIFSDGTVLRTNEYDIFYLPEGSSYQVKSIKSGSCYAINFKLQEKIDIAPFTIEFRNYSTISKLFKDANKCWFKKTDFYYTETMKYLYDIILHIQKESQKDYVPSETEKLIAPALEEINKRFATENVSVNRLAELCNISSAYFRRIFLNKIGISPKEYIIRKRIDYAMQLLKSGQVSVTDVSFMCGYSDPCHFSREFKKICGCSPKAYKNSKDD